MKTATARAVCFLLACPHCEEQLPEPKTGSFLWDIDDYTGKPETTCPNCGAKVRLPKGFNRHEGNAR